MKKLIILIIIVIAGLSIWQSASLYLSVREPLIINKEAALSYLKQQLPIRDINNINFYHGKETYYVANAVNEDDELVIVWINEDFSHYEVRRQADGLSLKEVEQFAIQQLLPKEIISIKLGIEKSVPLYEIIYVDQYDRYSYYYLHFENGTYLKHFHLKM